MRLPVPSKLALLLVCSRCISWDSKTAIESALRAETGRETGRGYSLTPLALYFGLRECKVYLGTGLPEHTALGTCWPPLQASH